MCLWEPSTVSFALRKMTTQSYRLKQSAATSLKQNFAAFRIKCVS